MEEIKVAEQVVETTEEITKTINWKSIGKKGGAVVVTGAVLYLGTKYVVKPLVNKFFKKNTEEVVETDVVDEVECLDLDQE